MALVKLIPHLVSWTLVALVLLRGFPRHRGTVAVGAAAGFILGVAALAALQGSMPSRLVYGSITLVLGGCFFLLWGVSVVTLYRSMVRDFPLFGVDRLIETRVFAGGGALFAGLTAGAVAASRLPSFEGSGSQIAILAGLALAGAALTWGARIPERYLPEIFTISPAGVMLAVMALILFNASSIIRLDLFSPLSMKVMKGTHDFVHQFMESVLIPDHIFVRKNIWGYIGFLFGKEVGFWGGMIIWFTPVLLVALATQVERLPSVGHIRQGARRRKLLAEAILKRRCRLAAPALALVVLAAAAYQSRFPNVEYWDPKPVAVTASAAGDIFIPKAGEIVLEDGKLHKFLFKQGGKDVRFFIVMTTSGKLTVVLDACAICKPDGYGQTEDMVICYYCNTLIPLDTVGKPGGCNPVPVAFAEKEDGVHLDSITLVNAWNQTVQSTSRVKEGGK